MFVSETHLPQLLPPGAYVDRGWYDRELEQVLRPTWWAVALEQALPREGSFVSFDHVDGPVLLRRHEGRFLAYLNVCSHRHCQLTSRAQGHDPRLVCQYHGWEYGPDGKVAKVPDGGCFKPFDRENARLQCFTADTCGELVFVRLAPEGPTLAEYLGEFHARVAAAFAMPYRCNWTYQREFACNWKIPVENTVETYHLPFIHPTTLGGFGMIPEELVVALAAERSAGRAGAAPRPPAFDPATLGRLFGDQMHVYRAYWRDDPRFDTSHTRAFAPDLPAPQLDDETIRRLCRFAIGSGFRWPPPGRAPAARTPRAALEARLGSASWSAAPAGPRAGLAVAGAGGGQWTLSGGSGGAASWHVGLPAPGAPVVRLTAARLAHACDERHPAAALDGALVEGTTAADRQVAVDLLTAVVMQAPGATAPAERPAGSRPLAAVR